MPRYELADEVWEIVHDGKELNLAVNGKPSTRKFVSPDHAAVQYTKLIAEREAAGWKLVAGADLSVAPRSDEPRELALEQHILDHLDDPDGYAVYADWYQTRQHPRGELIALQLAEETRGEDRRLHDAVLKLLARYKAELLGPIARHLPPSRESPLIWRNGFIHGLVFTGDDRPAEVIHDVVNHPSGRFVSSLELSLHDGGAIREALAAIAPAKATLRDIQVRTGASLSGMDMLASFAQLRTVSIATLDVFEADELGTFAKLSATCEALHLRCGNGEADWVELAPLFARDDLYLRTLTLQVPSLIDKVLVAVSEGPFARRVEALDFAFTEPDAGMRVFLANRGRFVKLRKLTVSVSRLTFEVRKALDASFKVEDADDDELAEELGYDDDDNYDEIRE